MELKRVVVTGLGAITPIGNDVATTWDNALKGVSGAGPITHFDASKFKTQFACEVKNFNGADHFDRKKLRQLDLYAQYALVAARQAVDDASLENNEKVDKNRVGVIIAAGIGGLHTFEEEAGYYASHIEDGPKYNPFFIPKMIADIASGHVSMEDWAGPSYWGERRVIKTFRFQVNSNSRLRPPKASRAISRTPAKCSANRAA